MSNWSITSRHRSGSTKLAFCVLSLMNKRVWAGAIGVGSGKN